MPRDTNFDPNEEIELPEGFTPPGEDPAVFQDLVRRKAAADPAGGEKATDFGLLKPEQVASNFSYFDRSDLPAVEGEFRFDVEQERLKEALITTAVSVSDHPAFNKVKCTLYRATLKLQTFNGVSFSECRILLFRPNSSPPPEPEYERPPMFVIGHELLLTIIRSVPAELTVVSFTYAVATQTLSFQTQDPENPAAVQKDFQLTCWPLSEFPNYRTQSGLANPTALGDVNPVILRQAVRYAAIFARKDETRDSLNMIELRQGTLFAGTQTRMGAIQAAELAGVDLQIKFEAIAPLATALARFSGYNISVASTERYYLLTGGPLVYAFERYSFHFPDIEDLYRHESATYCLVSRGQLIDSLTLLMSVNPDPSLLVHVFATGAHHHARLHLETRERAGKPCRDFLRVRRAFHPGQTTSDPLPDWQFSVEIRTLLKLVQRFADTTNVELQVLNNAALYIVDEEDGLTARGLLSFLTEAQLRKMKEQKAQATAAVQRTAFH